MLFKQIGRINLASDFADLYGTCAHLLLNPKSMCVEMSKLPEARTPGDERGARVCPHSDWHRQSKINHD